MDVQALRQESQAQKQNLVEQSEAVASSKIVFESRLTTPPRHPRTSPVRQQERRVSSSPTPAEEVSPLDRSGRGNGGEVGLKRAPAEYTAEY